MGSSEALHVLLVTSARCGHQGGLLRQVLAQRLKCNVTEAKPSDLGVPEFDGLASKRFSAVVIAGRCEAALTAGQESGLQSYVQRGGGLVILHQAAASFAANPGFTTLIGAKVEPGPSEPIEAVVEIDAAHRTAGQAMARGMEDLLVRDTPCPLNVVGDAEVFATMRWACKSHPAGYVLKRGQGRVIGLAIGGSSAAVQNPAVANWLCRAVRVAGGLTAQGAIRAGIIGYGGAFNMGKHHAELIMAQAGMSVTAVCDLDPKRTEQAKAELGPQIRTYNQIDHLLADAQVDLVVVILPHHLHASACLAASKAGKHVITEKPFCLSIAEADAMIDAADRAGKMLTVYHNRRFDADFQRILQIVRSGEIGEVFHVEAATAGYARPKSWWRSDKAVSGGALYDWGAHYADWLFHIVNRRVQSVSGVMHKRYWHQCTNEDFAQVYVRFEGGVSAILEQGSLAAIKRHGWRILGTRGGISNAGPGGELTLVTHHQDVVRETKLPITTGRNGFYHNIANHLFLGEPLLVTPQQARRTIALFDLAEQSHAQGGKPLAMPGEQGFVGYEFPA